MDKALRRVGTITAVRPNWSSPVTEHLEFLTSILTSRDGTERRESMRQSPRVTYEFTADAFKGLARRLTADFNQWPTDGIHVFPVRWRSAYLASDIAGGATLGLDRTPPWWMTAGAKMVIEGSEAQEVVEIAAIGAFSITLTESPTENFFIGDRIMLGQDVRYDQATSIQSLVATHRQSSVKLDANPKRLDLTDVGSTPRYHEGYEVLLHPHNWRSPISSTFDDQREVVDFNMGVIDVTRPINFTIHRETLNFTMLDVDAIDNMIGFFARQRGQRSPFWVPTSLNDAEYISGGSIGTTTVTIEGTEFLDAYDNDETYTTLSVKFLGGGRQFNRVISMVEDAGNTRLTVESAWVGDVAQSVLISFGFFARLMSDRLSITWLTDSIAETNISFKALPSAYMAPDGDFVSFNVEGPYTTNVIQDKTNPAHYTTLDFVAKGVPLSAIDRGLGVATIVCDANFTTKSVCSSQGLVGQTQISCQIEAFDVNGNLLALEQPASHPGSDSGFTEDSYSFSDTIILPIGSRFIRVYHQVVIDFCHATDFRSVFGIVSTRDWGLGYDIEDLL
jgi:hypothetical protein